MNRERCLEILLLQDLGLQSCKADCFQYILDFYRGRFCHVSTCGALSGQLEPLPCPLGRRLDSTNDFFNMRGLKPPQESALSRRKQQTWVRNRLYTLCPAPLPSPKKYEAKRVRKTQLLSVAMDDRFWVTFFFCQQHTLSRDS